MGDHEMIDHLLNKGALSLRLYNDWLYCFHYKRRYRYNINDSHCTVKSLYNVVVILLSHP